MRRTWRERFPCAWRVSSDDVMGAMLASVSVCRRCPLCLCTSARVLRMCLLVYQQTQYDVVRTLHVQSVREKNAAHEPHNEHIPPQLPGETYGVQLTEHRTVQTSTVCATTYLCFYSLIAPVFWRAWCCRSAVVAACCKQHGRHRSTRIAVSEEVLLQSVQRSAANTPAEIFAVRLSMASACARVERI